MKCDSNKETLKQEEKLNNQESFFQEFNLLAPWFESDKNYFFQEFWNKFKDKILNLTEFNYNPGEKNIGLLTQGNIDELFFELLNLIIKFGFSKKAINFFEKTQKYFKGEEVLFKLELEKDSSPIFALYYRQGIIPKLLKKLLIELEFNNELIVHLSKLIQKLFFKKAILGIGFAFKEDIIKKFYIANLIKESAPLMKPAIIQAMQFIELPASSIKIYKEIEDIIEEYNGRMLYTSISYADKFIPAITIDYENLSAKKVQALLKKLNSSKEEIDHLKEIAANLNIENLTYFGIKYLKSGIIKPELYFKRRYLKNKEKADLIDFVTKSKWRL